ncbi:glutaredoxin [Ascobolus immersus RN42]|uniref:Glutaredoxin n=1 Tax=Ascobolus immersus RN42 TaxID=1160509 RepID=A0A3N4IK39_ASCIM|nr:glutaredoxin [Ascobolus immersus RN42]
MPVHEISAASDLSTYISSAPQNTLVVLYFQASWARPCIQMAQALELVAESYDASSPTSPIFLSVDAEEVSDLAEEYSISSVPYLVFLKNGHKVDQWGGSDPKRLETTVKLLSGATNTVSAIPSSIPPQQQVSAPASSTAPATTQDAPEEEEDNLPLEARLEKLVNAAPIMLFMKGTPSEPQCGFSRQLVGILREKRVRFGFFNILADEEVRQGLKAYSDWPTYPQLYKSGNLVGGLDIVKEELEANPDFFAEDAASA